MNDTLTVELKTKGLALIAAKSLLSRLAGTLIDLVTSKKAIATAVAAIVALFVKDAATRDRLVGVIVMYIGTQGLVDHAKERAKAALGVATSSMTVTQSEPAAAPAPAPAADPR